MSLEPPRQTVHEQSLALLMVPFTYGNGNEPYLPAIYERHFRALLNCMGPSQRWIVVCHPEFGARVRGWFLEFRSTTGVDLLYTSRPSYSMWIQDPILLCSNVSDRPLFIVNPNIFDRPTMLRPYQLVSQRTGIPLQRASFHFSGGNIITGPKIALVGADLIERNLTNTTHLFRSDILIRLERTLKLNVLPLGGLQSSDEHLRKMGVVTSFGQQPIFHLDMYVTRTGVCGSTGKEIILLGRPSKTREILGIWSEVPDLDGQQFDALFEQTEEQLREEFEIQHLPLLLTFGRLDRAALPKKSYVVSFNNVICGYCMYEQRNFVISPNFSQDSFLYSTNREHRLQLEQSVKSVWESLHFSVRESDGIEDLAYMNGGLHCAVKEIGLIER